jgi:putative copper resistance protein D
MIWIYISETLLYLCFSLLIGSLILSLIPSSKKPDIKLDKRWIQSSILGIVVFSLVPIIRLVLFLYEDIGLTLTIQNVISSFEVGQAWTFTLLVSIVFYLYVSLFSIFTKKFHTGISLFFTFLLLLSLGWASHSASLTEWSGFVAHTLHFLAVTLWIGILIVVSWFSVNQTNWLAFLKWFTPVAISCLLVIGATGYFLMTLVIDLNNYANSWILPYGQSLLIKHLILIPIIFFACINGLWMKRKIQKGSNINPRNWVRAESLTLLLIFSATAVLGQQEPPHDLGAVATSNGMSKLFTAVYSKTITLPIQASMDVNLLGILLFVLSICFLIFASIASYKKASPFIAFILSILCIVSIYLGLMNSVVF